MTPLRSLCLVALLLASCASPVRWREVEHDAAFESMWNQLVRTATRSGYPANNNETDFGLKQYVSQWRSTPAPFRQGRRTRLHAEFERLDEKPGWRIRFYMEQQKVTDIAIGFEPEEDDWSDNGQDPGKEDVLLGQLRLAFGQDLGIRPSFETR